MKSRTSLFVIGIMIAMIAASLLTVLVMFLTGVIAKEKPELEFTVNEVEAKEYDGEPLKASGFRWASGFGNLKEGHRVEGEVRGSQTNYGTSETDLRVKVYDEQDSDVTNEYSIKVNNCDLTVLPREITVVLEAQKVQYSGKEVAIDFYKVYSGIRMKIMPGEEETEMIEGHKLVVSFPGKFENVGDKLPDFDDWADENFKIYDAAGVDVTNNYKMARGLSGSGTIEIVPRRIRVKAYDTEKYYDGTPIEGKYEVIGSLAEGDFIGEVKYVENVKGKEVDVSPFSQVDSKEVKISGIDFYRQEGYNLVQVNSDNYKLETSEDYVTLAVKKRPVTVDAKDLVKVYDGEPLSRLLPNGVSQFEHLFTVTNLPDKFMLGPAVDDEEKSEDNSFSFLNYVDVCDEIYNLGDLVVLDENNDDVSDQFAIIQHSGIARIKPITIQVALGERTSTYTGGNINISAADELTSAITSYIANNKAGDALSEALNKLTATCAPSKVKNAGTYSFSASITEPNKNINVNFSLGSITVEPKSIKVSKYEGTLSKVYDGLEASSILKSSNIVLEETGLTVAEANFECLDANATMCQNGQAHSVQGTVVRIKKSDGEDVTQNYKVQPFTVNVTITEKMLYASAGQAVVYYEVDNLASIDENEIANLYKTSIRFEGLAEGDVIEYSTLSISISRESDDCIKISVASPTIINSGGAEVDDCYDFGTYGAVITVYLREK